MREEIAVIKIGRSRDFAENLAEKSQSLRVQEWSLQISIIARFVAKKYQRVGKLMKLEIGDERVADMYEFLRVSEMSNKGELAGVEAFKGMGIVRG